MLDITFVNPALPHLGALVLLVAEGAEAAPAGLHAALEAATSGAVARALGAAGFTGKRGASCTLWAPALADDAAGPKRVVVVGTGKPGALDAAAAEAVGGALVPLLRAEPEAVVDAGALPPALAAHLAAGLALRAYRFSKYRTTEREEDRPKLERVSVAVSDLPATKAAWAPLLAVAEGVHLARDLVSEPPNVLHPEEFADRCRGLERLGVDVEVLDEKDLREAGFGALLGVAQGSAREPRVVVMRWPGGRKKKARKDAPPPLALIGKGVTFDTGGISLKPAAGMEDMKFDMAGAAAVIGAMAALAGRKSKAEVVGLVGLVENMPSGNAMRPGDVVKTLSGQTVEVINTDAEGRLVLADVITYAKQRFAPRAIVDLATLTGAMIVALGHENAGLFANQDGLAEQVLAAGRATGDTCWRMPLGEAYNEALKSAIADMKNVGVRPGGSISAAHFIGRFVGDTPWGHLDIAGTAWTAKDRPLAPKGATGWGVRLLDRLVAEHYEG